MSTHVSRRRILVSAAVSTCFAALLSGCGVDTIDHSVTGGSALHGLVHGGQQPVSGAIIQLYTVGNAAGSAGNGSVATPMLTKLVTSGTDGTFDITGAYTCGESGGVAINSPSNQVYIVATGGNPGLTPAVDNAALVMVTALGDCANLPSASYVEINEITTVAAAWALTPFASSYASIGASTTNVSGIKNAFLDAALLADSSTGLPHFPIPPPDVTPKPKLPVETPKLISLANAIASCVNSDGGSGCTSLFTAATPTGSVVPPTNTFAAVLNIVKDPGENVENVYKAISSTPPFGGGLTTAPHDWTMSLTVTGGGLLNPIALAVDAVGNVWVAGHDGPLSAFNPQGTPLTSTGYGVGELDQSNGIAIDPDGNIWVTQYNDTFGASSGAVTKFQGINAPSGMQGSIVLYNGYPGFYTDIYFPYAVAANTNGDIYVANNGNGSATVLNNGGSVLGDEFGKNLTNGSFPKGIAVDSTGGFWLPTNGINVDHISADGTTLLSSTACCATARGVATDSYGNVWVADYEGASFSEIGPDGTPLITGSTLGGIFYPQYLAVDAAQNVWFANVLGDSITEIAANPAGVSTGVPLSPSGTDGSGGYGHDASLSYASYIAPDPSGNIWVSNPNINTVTMFFGLATPTKTPIQPIPTPP